LFDRLEEYVRTFVVGVKGVVAQRGDLSVEVWSFLCDFIDVESHFPLEYDDDVLL